MRNNDTHGMNLIVKTITRLTLGFILLYGIYITFTGHRSPGGGFAGGVIIALSYIHIMLAFGKETALKHLHAHVLRMLIGAGGLVFLYVVMMNFAGKCAPMNLFLNKIKPCLIFNNEITIPFCEMAIVGGGLFAIFTALVLATKADKDSE